MEELEMGEEELAFYGGAAFDCGIDGSALSFIDLLGFHDSVFDFPPPPLPANSPSPSSSSTASAAELLACEEVDGKIATDINNGDRDGEKGRKGGKKGQKRQKQPRFAFMTKSEVDHLEDGYRWRKYGQKAVKNSPYARSYYRCTSPSCGVKKRVERSCDDPSVVVTTYEGQHIHPSPIGARGNPPATAFHQNSPFPIHHNQLHQHQHQQFMLLQQQHQQALHQQAFQLHLPPPPSPMVHFESIGFATGQPATTPSSAAIKDCGLLQDMVPSDIYDSHKE